MSTNEFINFKPDYDTKFLTGEKKQCDEEDIEYVRLLDIGTSLRTILKDCQTNEEQRLMILSIGSSSQSHILNYIEFQTRRLVAAGVVHKRWEYECFTDSERVFCSLEIQRNRVHSKLLGEDNFVRRQWMEPYYNLTIMTDDLYFKGTKLVKMFNQSQRAIIKYNLTLEISNVFETITKLEARIQFASSSERELILFVKSWRVHVEHQSIVNSPLHNNLTSKIKTVSGIGCDPVIDIKIQHVKEIKI